MKLKYTGLGAGIILIIIIAVIISVFPKGTSGNSILYVLPEKDFDYYEFTKSRDMLVEQGYKVILSSTVKGGITDDRGNKYECSLLVREVDMKNYRMLVLVGGDGTELILENMEIKKLIQQADKENKYIAAICYAPVVLANAGVLKGEEATVYPSHKKELEDSGAIYNSGSVVVSNNIITAGGPGDTKIFTDRIIEILGTK